MLRITVGLALLWSARLIVPVADAPLQTDTRLRVADSIVQAWVADERVAGAVLRVTRAARTVLQAAHGYARRYEFGGGQYPPRFEVDDPGAHLERLPYPQEMDITTVFDLASVTKVMATTMAVMMLVDRGLVELDAPVSRYLPDFVGGGKEAISATHLLTHRSGLEQWKPIYYHAENPDEAYAYIRDLPLGWPVGEERHYSDLGFMLLGRIVEAVSRRSLDDFVSEELYQPLGLRATGYEVRFGTHSASTGASGFAATSHGNPFERRMVYEPDFGYRIAGDPGSWDGWRRRTLSGEVNDGNAYHAFEGVAGHAGLFSNAEELGVLLQLLLDGGEYGGRRFIDDDVVGRFLETTGDNQALGWQNPPYAPDGSFGHTGFTGTFVLGVPGQEMTIVLLTNRQNGGVLGNGRYVDVGPLQRAVVEALTR